MKKRVLKDSDEKIVQIRNRNIRRKKNRRIAFGTILLLIGVMLAMLLLPCFNIKYIDTVGNVKVTQALLTEKSGVNYGDNIFKVNIKKAKKQIQNIPYVETVKVKRKLPDIIIIEVEERKPLAAISAGEGFALIDGECRILEMVNETNVPVVTGIDVKIQDGKFIGDEKPQFAVNFKKIINLLEENSIKNRITHYVVDEDEKISFVIDSTKTIILGEETNIEYKLLLLESAINELPPTQKGVIDLSNEGQALYSPEE